MSSNNSSNTNSGSVAAPASSASPSTTSTASPSTTSSASPSTTSTASPSTTSTVKPTTATTPSTDTKTATNTATTSSTNAKPATNTTTTSSTDTKTATTAVDMSTAPANSSLTDDIKNTFNKVFTSSNFILLLWFLAVYFVAYTFLGLFNTNMTGTEYIIKIVDVMVMIAIFAYLLLYYYNNPKSVDNIQTNTYNTLNDTNTLIYTGIFLVCYTAISFVFQIPTSGPGSILSLWLLSTLAIIVFTITAIVLFCKYVLGISILDTDSLKSIWKGSSSDNSDKSGGDTPKPTPKSSSSSPEVFNVSNNLYTYDDARAVCTAFGARLATYNEIEDAYNKGGEWCSYGWSEGQMAYFPTQKSTWEDLQKNPKTKNNCGRPGVNGGYMENPYIKFGVNCYGTKPKPTDRDLQTMANNKLQPKTEEDALMDKKVNFWKENADKLLNLNAFNRNSWSEY